MRYFHELNNHELVYRDNVKNLGVIINKTLTWNDQVTAICNKVFASIHSIKRVSACLSLKVKIMLVKTLVLPHFNYCDVAINDMTVELSNKLQRAQNYCIRFLFDLNLYDHVTPHFNNLSLLKLKELRNYHTICLLHKTLSTKVPKYLFDRFKFINNNPDVRNTRYGELLLSVPPHRSNAYNKSFTVTSCRLWNNLDVKLKIINNCGRFGKKIKNILLQGLEE